MVPIRARLYRRALSVGLALLLGASACTTDYGVSTGATTADYAGIVARESPQTDLEASAEKAKAALRKIGSSVPNDQIDGLVARAKDQPDPNKGEISKKDAADALDEITDLARRENVNAAAVATLVGKVVNASNANQLAQALAEVKAVLRAADDAAPGTQVDAAVGVDMGRNRKEADLGNGQKVELDEITDADVVYKDKGGTVHVKEVKNAGSATRKAAFANQVKRLKEWADKETGRKATVEIETTARWTHIFSQFDPGEDDEPARDPRTAAHEMAKNGVDLKIAGEVLSADQLGRMQRAVDERKNNGTMAWPEMKDPKSAKAYLGITAQEATTVKEAVEEVKKNLGLPSGCSEPDGSQALGIADLSQSAPCGGEESGLSSALSSPTYGGVDFSSLQLRFLSDDADSGVQYAFSAKAAQEGLEQESSSGLSALVESLADLRTWLVLSPDTFWVNLSPDEPDRIIDTKLGQTNAGRALLEADWRMKQTQGTLLDPKTSFGAEYWRQLGGSSGQVCYSSRMWIVPGDVEVREDGDSLYVLKATLDVKAKAEDVAGLGQSSCNADPAETARNERLEQEMLVPKIVQAVNSDPEYAPLRRAFLARVIAQWIRDRHAGGHSTSFDELIDSGDLGPASLRGSWQPKQVYDAYLRSINEGEFTYERTTRVGDTTVTYVMRTGGVDFGELPSKKLSSAEMDQQVPRLAQTIRQAVGQPATASDGSVWLGDTAAAPQVGTWDRIRTYLGGRTGILVIVVVALAILLLFVRDGSAFRRKSPG